MGTRRLAGRPWLVADGKAQDELALKRRLLAERHGEVFAAEAGSEPAGREALDLVLDHLGDPGDPGDRDGIHPLDDAGRRVQEDLCLLRPEGSGWILAAASLCFPSRWRLSAKMGRPLPAVHEPVAGYGSQLAGRVDGLLGRLDQQVVWRRNWFVHPDPALFQPDRPPAGDPVVPAGRCLAELYLRSERQTLRLLAGSGWVLFTIRVQQEPLSALVARPARHRALARFLGRAPDDQVTHHGISSRQRHELESALQPI
jgi:hypothetical protein